MADETTEVTTETTETPDMQENNIQISVEQICAAIIKTMGSVEVALEDLITDYSNKSIAVNQDETTKALTFTLSDSVVPASEESPAESE
jgi:hypothetical protein